MHAGLQLTFSSARLQSGAPPRAMSCLLPHEKELLAAGSLRDVTHSRARADHLRAECRPARDGWALLYRHMGDREAAFLMREGVLPDTQPYQTVVRGAEGRAYCEKYLFGRKRVNTAPTTVFEFEVPAALADRLFTMQHKPEDGCLSHGLGDKGGRGLPLFNESLRALGRSAFRVVTVRRPRSKPKK